MSKTEVTLYYERKYSDGNYGSEGLSLSAHYELDDTEFTSEYALDRADWLRTAVLSFLANSNADRVAYMARRELSAGEPSQPAAAKPQADESSLEDPPF